MEFLDFKGLKYFYENISKEYVGMIEPKVLGSKQDTTLYLDEDIGVVVNDTLKISPIFAFVKGETLILDI